MKARAQDFGQLDIFFKNRQIPQSMPSSRQTDQQDDHKDPFPCPKGHQTRENQQKETRLFGPREVYCAFSLNDKELKKATRTEMQQNMDLHGYKLLKNH